MKRFSDFVLAVFLILLLSPIMLLIAILISVTSKGSVIFKQKRVGKNKKLFNIYKFRTMYVNAPKNVATHLLEGSCSYITPVGSFLRKSSLDEIPQLFNILKGEMSFIGPRPALYNQYDLIEQRDIHGINSLYPGITGWAQINGRDEVSIEEKVLLDKYYNENASVLFDLKIVFFTLLKVISAKDISEGGSKKI
jgi:O-antigen biosynthesis protein WbqP